VDKDVRIPASFVVGENAEDDKKRFTVTPGGVVVIPRGTRLD
jgi:glucose-1-phosphate adenylyltransferase